MTSLLHFDGANNEDAKFIVIEAVNCDTNFWIQRRDEVKANDAVIQASYNAWSGAAPRVLGSYLHSARVGEWLRMHGTTSNSVVIIRSDSKQEAPFVDLRREKNNG